MKHLLAILAVTLSLSGCQGRPVTAERPRINIPLACRQTNWRGSNGQGSCVWATTVSLLRWQGRFATANWVMQNLGNGASLRDAARTLDNIGVRFAYAVDADVHFLEWAVRTRRGVGVPIQGGEHFVALVHLDSKCAMLLDNNDVDHLIVIPRERFLAEWRASGGWALTVVYAPAAPLPQ